MEKIVTLTSDSELKAYSALCRYSFSDSNGWTDHIHPLPGARSYTMAVMDDRGRALSGVSNILFTTRYFGRDWKSGGISAVASDPSARNSGQIRRIMNEIIRRDYDSGREFSYLYPFSYRFYNKFGYGTLGSYIRYRFSPEDIKKQSAKLQISAIAWERKEFEEMCNLHNRWIQDIDGGIYWPYRNFEEAQQSARRFLQYYYLFRDDSGKLKAWIRLSKTDDPQNPVLSVQKAVWDDPGSLNAIFEFLARHRQQISLIEFPLPPSLPLPHFLNEPRLKASQAYEWMARPIRAADVLEAAVSEAHFTGDLDFFLDDPVLPENSGLYRLHGGQLEFDKSALTGSADSSLPGTPVRLELKLFSSLLFGGISLKQARIAGLLGESDLAGGEDLFKGGRNIYISDRF